MSQMLAHAPARLREEGVIRAPSTVEDIEPDVVEPTYQPPGASGREKLTTAALAALGAIGGGLQSYQDRRGRVRTRFDIGGALQGGSQGLMGGLGMIQKRKAGDIETWQTGEKERTARLKAIEEERTEREKAALAAQPFIPGDPLDMGDGVKAYPTSRNSVQYRFPDTPKPPTDPKGIPIGQRIPVEGGGYLLGKGEAYEPDFVAPDRPDRPPADRTPQTVAALERDIEGIRRRIYDLSIANVEKAEEPIREAEMARMREELGAKQDALDALRQQGVKGDPVPFEGMTFSKQFGSMLTPGARGEAMAERATQSFVEGLR